MPNKHYQAFVAALHISYELQYVYTIRRARWYVAGKEWEINNGSQNHHVFRKAWLKVYFHCLS